jgi:hypothetical protein
MSVSYKVVVSRYSEKLNWLSVFPTENVIIYNKGLDFTTPYEVKRLPNVGRESHTYLSYIVENYENLPDIVIFTQGGFDHFKYSNILTHDPDNEETPFTINLDRLLNIKSCSLNFNITRFNTALKNYRLENWNSDSLDVLRLNDTVYNGKMWVNQFIAPINLDVIAYPIWWGACFSIRRECILSRPKEFYQELITHLDSSRNPEAGHFFERAWGLIFNLHTSQFDIL